MTHEGTEISKIYIKKFRYDVIAVTVTHEGTEAFKIYIQNFLYATIRPCISNDIPQTLSINI